MSTTSKVPFNRSEATPQAIQKLLDENAQLIRVLVENMNSKGKSTECIQYQQTLHRNLVFLAGLADPSLNLHSIIPHPGSSQYGQSQPQQQTSSTSTSAPSSTSAPPTSSVSAPPPPRTSTGMSGAAPMSGQPPSHPASQQPASQHQQHATRQPQATMQGAVTSTSGSEVQWSSSGSSVQRPPSSVDPGHYSSMKQAYASGGSSWGPQGPSGMYGMQRGAPPSMMGGGGGSYPPMGGPGMAMDEHRRQQLLRMRQEQYIQAQQRRLQQQQQQVQGGMHGGGMYPGAGGMMPPPPPHPHSHPHQGTMPPGYPQSRMTPPNMPPGPMPM